MHSKTLTVIGAGPGGYVAAVRAAQKGMKVTIIENGGLGGVCLQQGCIPVKALLHSVRVLKSAENAGRFGVDCEVKGIDYSRMVSRKDDIVSLNERGIEALLHRHKVSVIKGRAKLQSPTHVEVLGEDGASLGISSDYILIATGSSSLIPAFVKLDGDRIFDCEGALALTELPESCIILGGGVLGCEFASLYADLGVKVSIVEMQGSLMPFWDPDMTKLVARSFKRRRINVRTAVSVDAVENVAGGDITVTLSDGEILSVASCLVALGRKPNVDGIGLESAGVVMREDGFGIAVDEFLRTNISNIYAAGDVTAIRMLAHVASEQGIIAADHMAGGKTAMRYDAVPDCYWGAPEMASAGMNEVDAKEAGINVATATFQYRSMGIAHALGEIEGFVKAIVDRGSERVIGVHIIGHSAPELIGEASVIVTNGLTVHDLERTIHAHPSLAEIVKESILGTLGRNIH